MAATSIGNTLLELIKASSRPLSYFFGDSFFICCIGLKTEYMLGMSLLISFERYFYFCVFCIICYILFSREVLCSIRVVADASPFLNPLLTLGGSFASSAPSYGLESLLLGRIILLTSGVLLKNSRG